MFPLAGCGGKSFEQLAHEQIGADYCDKVGVAEIAGKAREVWSCYRKDVGGSACVTRDGDDIYVLSAEQALGLAMDC